MNTKETNIKNVIISITGTQEDRNGYGDSVELVTDGLFEYKNGSGSFSYMESELTGLDGTKTTFFFDPASVTLNREGTVNSQMYFEQGKKHNFLYETPFGSTTMGVNTKSISCGLNEHGGSLEIDYMVDYQQAVIGHNTFKINIREQKVDN